MKKFKAITLFIIGVILLIGAYSVNAATLKWDVSTGDVVGYTVYWGKIIGEYPYNNTPGNVTEVLNFEDTFGLQPDTLYYLKVRSYNTKGESGDSNVVEYTTPVYSPPLDNMESSVNIPTDPTGLISE